MIRKVYPSSSDYENLSRLRTEMSDYANVFDYSGVIVNKPWGYEYLWFQNAHVAIWILNMRPGCATSLHCHIRKRTSLIVLDGAVACSTLDSRFSLMPHDAIVIEPCVFHSSLCVSQKGCLVMEVETPPLKGDLVRLHDSFGRTSEGYETAASYSRDISNYDYSPYEQAVAEQVLGSSALRIASHRDVAALDAHFSASELCVPLSHSVALACGRDAEIGEVVGDEAPALGALRTGNPVQVLTIR